LQTQVPELGKPIQQLKELKETKKALNKEKNQLPGSAPFSINFDLIFSELSSLVSDNTSLSQIIYAAKGSSEAENQDEDLTSKGVADTSNRERIKVKGEIFGNGLKVQSSLRVLLQDLKNSPVFSDIKLIKSAPLTEGQYNSPGIKFELYVFPAPNNSA
jgi:hypothetical protein